MECEICGRSLEWGAKKKGKKVVCDVCVKIPEQTKPTRKSKKLNFDDTNGF